MNQYDLILLTFCKGLGLKTRLVSGHLHCMSIPSLLLSILWLDNVGLMSQMELK